MFFTQEDFKKIEEYLKKNSKKDTDFPLLESEDILLEEDVLVVVHNGINYKVPIGVLAGTINKNKDNSSLEDKISELEERFNELAESIATEEPDIEIMKHIVLTERQYDALEEYEEDALYLVTEDDEEWIFPIVLG